MFVCDKEALLLQSIMVQRFLAMGRVCPYMSLAISPEFSKPDDHSYFMDVVDICLCKAPFDRPLRDSALSRLRHVSIVKDSP